MALAADPAGASASIMAGVSALSVKPGSALDVEAPAIAGEAIAMDQVAGRG